MRRLLYIIIGVIALCVVSTGCENKALNRQLDDLDTLMRVRPDSVYAVLDSMDTHSMSKRQRMRHALLLADAQNKAYIDFTTDSAMIAVADYYDHHGTPNEQMRAHYLLGCTYRDMGDVPMELQCFLDATEKADTASKECDLYTLSAIYGQTANIYHSQFLPQEELNALSICEDLSKKYGDDFSAIKAYELRLRAYDILGMPDSVLTITRTARARYMNFDKTSEASLLTAPAIGILINRGRYDEAYKYIELFENTPVYKDSLGNVNKKYAILLYDKGKYALHKNRIAEAKDYFHKLMEYGEKEAAYNGLLALYKKTTQLDSLAKYAELYAQANDSSYVNMNSKFIEQMTASYNYSRQEQIAKKNQLEKEKEKEKNLILLITLVSILLIASVIAFFAHNRYKKHIAEKNREISVATQTLLAAQAEKAIIEQEIKTLCDERNTLIARSHSEQEEANAKVAELQKKLSEHQQQIETLKSRIDIHQSHAMTIGFLDTNICKKLKVYATVTTDYNKPTQVDWIQFVQLAKQYFADYYMFLTASNQLSSDELLLCLLMRADFSSAEIKRIMGKEKNRLTNMRADINLKLFGEKSASKLNNNLLSHY